MGDVTPESGVLGALPRCQRAAVPPRGKARFFITENDRGPRRATEVICAAAGALRKLRHTAIPAPSEAPGWLPNAS